MPYAKEGHALPAPPAKGEGEGSVGLGNDGDPAPLAKGEGEALLRVDSLSKSFGPSPVLSSLSLDVREGEFLVLLGPSGCGKTTLLNAIAGLETPDEGSIRFRGRDITSLPPEKRRFGFVFQSYALFPNLTAAQNAAYGLHGKPKEFQKARAAEMLDLVGLADLGDRRPAELSGGQQQRVALARALAPEPALLLLDEPLSALDARIRTQLGAELRRVQRAVGIAAVMVTHDQQEAMALADRIVLMHEGRIEQEGAPEDFYRNPATSFAASFIGSMNFLSLPGGESFAIRCEDVAVGEATELSLRREDTWAAQILDRQYLGRFVRLELVLQDLRTKVRAELPPSAFSRFRCGDIVALSLPKAARKVWRGGEA